jgi:hypothetical protein
MREIRFEQAESGLNVDFSVEGHELERLDNYCSNVESLMKQPFLKHAPTIKKIAFNNESGFVVVISEFDRTALQAALLVSRFVILQDEPFSFLKTQSLLKKACIDNSVRDVLKQWARQFKHGQLSQFGNLSTLDWTLFSGETFSLWLNSTVYHQDASKQDSYRELCAQFGPVNVEKIMVSLFSDKLFSCLKLYGAVCRSVRCSG